jgi:hypothetical protein
MKKILPRDLPVRKNPGDDEPLRCTPGSIEQQLDMCEGEDSLRGDDILYSHGKDSDIDAWDTAEIPELIELLEMEHIDMSEPSREGDEDSGDNHSAGLQGGEPELTEQPHIETGLPGDMTGKEEDTSKKETT